MRERKTREWEERCETRTARTRRASGRSGVRRGRRARRRGEAARARATCTHPLDAETARVRCHPLASEAGRARADEREAAWAQRRPSLELRGAHARVAAEARPPREGETRRRARPVTAVQDAALAAPASEAPAREATDGSAVLRRAVREVPNCTLPPPVRGALEAALHRGWHPVRSWCVLDANAHSRQDALARLHVIMPALGPLLPSMNEVPCQGP